MRKNRCELSSPLRRHVSLDEWKSCARRGSVLWKSGEKNAEVRGFPGERKKEIRPYRVGRSVGKEGKFIEKRVRIKVQEFFRDNLIHAVWGALKRCRRGESTRKLLCVPGIFVDRVIGELIGTRNAAGRRGRIIR